MNSIEKDKNKKELLWKAYFQNPSQENRNELIVAYAPLVKYVAGRLSFKFSGYIEQEDMESVGIIGLIKAIDKFDPNATASFETYAQIRIRGEIIDDIRKNSILPHKMFAKFKEYSDTVIELLNSLGREPTDEEVATKMGISLKSLHDLVISKELSSNASLDALVETGMDFEAPKGKSIDDKIAVKQAVEKGLSVLTEAQKRVILLFFYEDMTNKEIAVTLGVSESRVTQLRGAALERMRKELGDFEELLNI